MSDEILTEDEYLVTRTSYRSFKVLTPKGDVYYVFADPVTGFLKCSCLASAQYKRHRACKHIKMIKRYFDTWE